jgi:pimeloyl-ACP methyl ester carboxylesterase
MTAHRYGPADTFAPRDFPEHRFDTGEITLNYAVAGSDDKPALLLIPSQAESWWGYEASMHLLQHDFHCYAVDLRGQGRSTWTPGRYTLDNFGNDLVRFIAGAIGRPVIVSGLSSGGVLSAWLSAYGLPGSIRGALCEDPPLFASETSPSCGPSIRQGAGPLFAFWNKYLGDQWSIGAWDTLVAAAPSELPAWMAGLHAAEEGGPDAGPPQHLREYDPEWGRAFWTGTATIGCDHARMLAAVKTPVLLTHHFHTTDESGNILGALADVQAARARELITAAGNRCDYLTFPEMGHAMHTLDPALYAKTLTDWAQSLPPA